MKKLAQIIRLKIILAFTACVMLVAAIGLFGIASLSRLNANIVGEISVASEEQSRVIKQVNQAVMQMDEVTQQNAALVEQAAAAAHSLEEQALHLKGAVSVFNVADTGFSPIALDKSIPPAPKPLSMPEPLQI